MTDHLATGRLVAVASAGSVAMAASSWWLAAVSVHEHPRTYAPVSWLPAHGDPAHVAFYLGLAAFTLAWLGLGRRLLDRRSAGKGAAAERDQRDGRLMRRFVLVTATPLLFAAPFGRDLWAYAAQGHLTGTGIDPYTHGPAAAPGAFADEVSARWLHSSAPYGPLWLRLSQLAAWAAHGHPEVAVLLLRLPEFAALLLAVWSVGVLAERLGDRRANGRADRLNVALWLGLASPLVIVLGLGGGHNDLLMIALALAGLAVGTRPGLRGVAAGAAIAAAAVMIKSPAAIVVAFTVPCWLHATGAPRTPRHVATAVTVAVGSALITIGALTAATGLGFGWTRQVNADAQWVSWLSLPTAVAMLGKAVTGGGAVRELDDTMRACRTVGEVVAVVLLVALWLLALRGRPLGWLAGALGAAALLAPSVQPWYYAWGLIVVGLIALPRKAVVALTAVGLMFPIMITPSGYGYESDWRAPVIGLGALLAAAFALRRARSVAHDDGPDDPGAEVGPDDGAELGHVQVTDVRYRRP